jgi:hypothetical protein
MNPLSSLASKTAPLAISLALAAFLPAAAAPPAAAAEIAATWQPTRWGEDSGELARQFDGRVTKVTPPIDFGDSYVDLVLRNTMIGGYPFTVFFQMDKKTHGLKRIQIERQRHGATLVVARALLAELEAEYGRPDKLCGTRAVPSSGYQAAAERLWHPDKVVIHAIFRDTTLEASEGCAFGAFGVWTCGLTGQLLIRIGPAGGDTDRCG